MNDQEARLTLIEMGLEAFLEKFLPDEAMPYLVALWEAVERSKALNPTRGDPDTWAAAIACAFARMNGLLDGEGPLSIERDEFFAFFGGCNRATVTQRAARVERALDPGSGHPDFRLPDVLKTEFDGPVIEIGFLNEAEGRELELQLAEQARAREEETMRRRHEKLRRQREEERRTQPELFDFGD